VIALHSFWATNLPFALIVWCVGVLGLQNGVLIERARPCRMVLVLTMARVLPHQHRARIHSFIVAGIMAACGIGMLLVSIQTCRKSKFLDRKDPRYCITVGKMPVGVFLGVISELSLVPEFEQPPYVFQSIWAQICSLSCSPTPSSAQFACQHSSGVSSYSPSQEASLHSWRSFSGYS